MERESRFLEYKESVTKSFLKTVSAFANYGSGKIIFGITDNYEIKGIKDPIQTCLNLENSINDHISPTPSFTLEIKDDKTIVLTIKEGLDKPYLYNGKAYKRSDSSTVEVDRLALTRLILEGSNKSFEELDSKEQNLTFEYLKTTFIEKIGIKEFNQDTLKTLQLMNFDNVYNNAGALLADKNSFKGIDIVHFGDSINEITNRVTLENMCLIKQFHKTLEVFGLYYEVEIIEGFERKKVELIPRNAFREAIANALVHRLWDINANIRVSFFKNKIEVTSPGGLPNDLSEEDYINGNLSILRNPIIGNIFFRLNYIERFGTGIKKINAAYSNSFFKPSYKITDTSISIILPVINNNIKLSDNEMTILNHLLNGSHLKRTQIEQLTGLTRMQTIRTLNSLIEKNLISFDGAGRNLKYSLK